MTNPFRDAATKDVQYPDEQDTIGTVELVSESPIPADDVPDDDAKHGDWIQVKQNGSKMWLTCPTDLARALGEADAEPGHVFQIRETSRGDQPHDPWEYQVAHDPEQH